MGFTVWLDIWEAFVHCFVFLSVFGDLVIGKTCRRTKHFIRLTNFIFKLVVTTISYE